VPDDPSLDAAKQLYADGESAFGRGEYRRALDVFAEVIVHPGADVHAGKSRSASSRRRWRCAVCSGRPEMRSRGS